MNDFPSIDLSVLTARQRMVVVLRYYDNWTNLEIANAIGITVRNVERCHRRAIARLHDAVIAGQSQL